jgi:hypothetical protein
MNCLANSVHSIKPFRLWQDKRADDPASNRKSNKEDVRFGHKTDMPTG